MDFNQLKAIYPDAFLADKRNAERCYISFPFQEQWVHFMKESISATEIDLLKLVLDKQGSPSAAGTKASEWYTFLLSESYSVFEKDENYRIIQFQILKKDIQFDQTMWLNTFKSLFDGVEDAFFIDETSGLIIEKETIALFNAEELSAMIQTIDDDFSIRTLCYVGQFWPVTLTLRDIFKEEQTIFHNARKKGDTILTLSAAALQYYTEDTVQQSPVMNELKNQLDSYPEMKELVLAMWRSQGNITLAAKSIYIHRNTLQYRIERFQELSGLSLRNMDDLVLCYLLLL